MSPYSRPYAPSVLFSLVVALLASVSSIAFSLSFHKAMKGFGRQIEAFVPLTDWHLWILYTLLALFTLLFVLYLVAVHLASLHLFTGCLNKLGTSCILFFSSFSSQAVLLLWVCILCSVCSLSLLYFVFIGSIYSFCALVDQQCFDFKVLLPAIVRTVSNKKVDLTFCEEKKQVLCNRENNMVWTFGWAIFFGFAAFAGLLLVQNTVVYAWGKRQGSAPIRREKRGVKGEIYEMTDKDPKTVA